MCLEDLYVDIKKVLGAIRDKSVFVPTMDEYGMVTVAWIDKVKVDHDAKECIIVLDMSMGDYPFAQKPLFISGLVEMDM